MYLFTYLCRWLQANESMHLYAAMVVYWPSFRKEGEGENIMRL